MPEATWGSGTWPPDPVCVREARAFVADLLVRHGLESLVDDALLVVCELVTNAVCHARTPFSVTLGVEGDSVLVRVADGLGAEPVGRGPDAEALGGRGLHLVAAVAVGWGVLRCGDGKVVWARLSRTPSA